jgi:hypothetical protein
LRHYPVCSRASEARYAASFDRDYLEIGTAFLIIVGAPLAIVAPQFDAAESMGYVLVFRVGLVASLVEKGFQKGLFEQGAHRIGSIVLLFFDSPHRARRLSVSFRQALSANGSHVWQLRTVSI